MTENTDTTFPPPPLVPTQTAAGGIFYDFNRGARVYLADNSPHDSVTVTFIDADTGVLAAAKRISRGQLAATDKIYRIRWRVIITAASGETLLDHTLTLRDRRVFLPFAEGALGDCIAWLAAASLFADLTHSLVTAVIAKSLIPLFAPTENLKIISRDEADANVIAPYATYYLGIAFDDPNRDHNPEDYRALSLPGIAAAVLGIPEPTSPPKSSIASQPDRISSLAAIATQSTKHCKCWNNAGGWHELVAYLNSRGYSVHCIDREAYSAFGSHAHTMPAGVINDTGNRPITERLDLLSRASLFVGLSSGLTWLAWLAKVPNIFIISGFTSPLLEPFGAHIQNPHTCHSCWNNAAYEWNANDALWCPRFKDSPRAYECSTLITPQLAIASIARTMPKSDQ